MKQFIILILFITSITSQAQDALFNMQIPSKYFLLEDNVPLVFTKSHPGNLAIYIEVFDEKGSLVNKDYFLSEQPRQIIYLNGIDFATLGSYIISSYIYEKGTNQILQEVRKEIHFVGERKANYFSFYHLENADNRPASTNTKINEVVAFDLNESIWVDEVFSNRSKLLINNTKDNSIPDDRFKIFYKLNDEYKNTEDLLVVNKSSKTTEKLFKTNSGLIYHNFNKSEAKDFIFINIKKSIIVENPFEVWNRSNENLINPNRNVLEVGNDIYKQLLLSSKISTHYNQHTFSSLNTMASVVSDNEYVIKFYPTFDKVDKFFKEVVQPLKISKDAIYLLSGVNKTWNKEKALLMIDDKIIEDHSQLFLIPLEKILSIKLFRKIETFKKHYGLLARNGLVEVVTKDYIQPKLNSSLLMKTTSLNKDDLFLNANPYLLYDEKQITRKGSYEILNIDDKLLRIVKVIE